MASQLSNLNHYYHYFFFSFSGTKKKMSSLEKKQTTGEHEEWIPLQERFRQEAPHWAEMMKDELDKPYFQEWNVYLQSEYSNHTVYPPVDKLFRAFVLTDSCVDLISVLWLGQDPYHGPGQADGCCFSSPGFPPSLKNILTEMIQDMNETLKLGLNAILISKFFRNGDLTYLSAVGTNRVLLLNTCLTVRKGLAKSHSESGSVIFVKAVLDKLFSRKNQVLVAMAWGMDAYHALHRFQLNTDPETKNKKEKHLLLTSTHPSPFSYDRPTRLLQAFEGSRPFSKANAWLKLHGTDTIDWLSSK